MSQIYWKRNKIIETNKILLNYSGRHKIFKANKIQNH